jgi:DNA-binding MarR family transcriptional regulator
MATNSNVIRELIIDYMWARDKTYHDDRSHWAIVEYMVKEIADHYQVKPSAVSRVIRLMVADGTLHRERTFCDRRKMLVAFAKRGTIKRSTLAEPSTGQA